MTLHMAFLLDIGAIATCDVHEEYYYSTDAFDDSELYARATSVFNKSNKYRLYSNHKAFHAAIKDVLDNAGVSSDCPHCQKSYNE